MPRLRLPSPPRPKGDWRLYFLTDLPHSALARTMVRGLRISTTSSEFFGKFETLIFRGVEMSELARARFYDEAAALGHHEELVSQICRGEGDLLDPSWPIDETLDLMSWRRNAALSLREPEVSDV